MSSAKKKRELNRARTEAEIAKAANWSDATIWKAGCVRMETEIAELKRQLEEMQGGCASYIILKEATQKMTQRLLLESQAREARLCASIKKVKDNAGNPGHVWRTSKEALSFPQDDTALKEYRDAVIDDCIDTAMVAGVDGAINIANDLREMKGGV